MFLTRESFVQTKNLHDLTHWHDKLEIIRVLKHSMYCIINGVEYRLSQGDVCIINKAQLHSICHIDESSCEFQRLMIDSSLFTADKEVYQKYICPMLDDETFSRVIVKAGSRLATEISNIMDEIEEVETQRALAFELRINSLLFLLIQRLYQHYTSIKDRNNSLLDPDILLYRRMADYIYQNYAEKLTLDAIAASGNVSRSKCCTVFQEYANHSPIAFLNLYRLKVSIELLQDTSQSIACIAGNCGFGQQSYYNRLFLREYQQTPKEYRENLKKEKRL